MKPGFNPSFIIIPVFLLFSPPGKFNKTTCTDSISNENWANNLFQAEIIYRSFDQGNSWQPFAKGIDGGATVSAFLSRGKKIYAATDQHGIYSIHEGNTNWTHISKGLPAGTDINALIEMKGVFIIGTFKNGILLSTDSCRTWKSTGNNITNTPVRCLVIYQNKIFAGTDNGIYESNDKGNSWQQLFRGSQVNGFTILHHKIYAASADGVLISEKGGSRWRYIYRPHTIHDIANDGKYIYATTLGEGLLKSNNDGLSWSHINHGLGPANLYTFEVKHINNQLFAAQWKGIYRSLDGGKSWQLIKNGLPASTAFTTLDIVPGGMIAGIGLRKK